MTKGNTGNSNFRLAFWINLVFSLIEFAGGLFFGSLAILSDALHDFSDSVSIGIGWYFQRVSQKRRTKVFSYGFRRFSVLGAVINAVILLVGGGFIIYHAIMALFDPGDPNALGMMGLAVIGVAFNLVAYLKMHSGKSLNEQVVSLHLMEDVLGWVAVFIGGAIHYFFNIPLVDPILSLMISVFITYKAIVRLRHCLHLMLQGVPDNIDLEKVGKLINSHDLVIEVIDIHAWSMDGDNAVLTIHLSIDDSFDMNSQGELKKELKDMLQSFPINHVTIDLEHQGKIEKQMLTH